MVGLVPTMHLSARFGPVWSCAQAEDDRLVLDLSFNQESPSRPRASRGRPPGRPAPATKGAAAAPGAAPSSPCSRSIVDLRVVAHDVVEGGEAAVVHVRRGHGDVAQRRHAELAPVAVLRLHVPRRRAVALRRIVVVAAEQVERAGPQRRDAAVAALVDAARLGEVGHADVVELAVGEVRRRSGRPCTGPCRRRSCRPALRRRRDSAPWPAGRRARARRGNRRTACARSRWSPGTPPAPWRR